MKRIACWTVGGFPSLQNVFLYQPTGNAMPFIFVTIKYSNILGGLLFSFFELAVGNLYRVKVVLQVKCHWMVYILEYLKWKMGIFPCLVVRI